MFDLLLTAVAAATVSNVALSYLVGLETAGTAAGNVARPVAVATAVALLVAAGAGHVLEHGVLAPAGLAFLRVPCFLAVAMLAVRLGTLAAGGAGHAVPFTTTTGVVLAVLLLTTTPAASMAEALALAAGTGIGYGALLCLFAALRPRLERAPVPAPFRGPAILLVTFGIVALAVLGFAGVGA
jgi:electron transport complex protein RnfA